MKVKVVYILSSSSEDVYLEQTIVSILSLLYHNPDAIVELIVDRDTASSLTGIRDEIKKHISRLIVSDTPDGYDNKKKSRFLKTHLRSLVDGDFLFIDGDTVIARQLDSINDMEGEICAVADHHVPFNKLPAINHIRKQLLKSGVMFDENDYYKNSGVMLVRDTPLAHRLYEEWARKWTENVSTGIIADQPALAYADAKLGYPIKLIDGHWNCQVCKNGACYLHDAYIIHYFASNVWNNTQGPYLLLKPDIFLDFKNSGELSPQIESIIRNPWSAFPEICYIVGEEESIFLNSNLRKLYYSHRQVFNFLNRMTYYLFMAPKRYLRKL